MKGLVALAVVALAAGSAQAQTSKPDGERKTRGVRIIPAQELPPAPVPYTPPPAAVTPAPRPAATLPVSPITTESALPTPPARCERAFASADLAYADTREFDGRLRDLLQSASASSRVVDVPGFAPEAAPARLQPWLAEVQRTGGKVSTQEIRCTRTRGFNVLKFLSKLFRPIPEDIYAPAKDWDAVLWTEAAGGQVRQVQFTRRAAAAG